VTAPAADAAEPSLDDVLDLEEIDRDLYRSLLVYPDEYALYGGQVAAQALLAAGRTVDAERVPHSLHCYFLRSGNAERPTVFRVDRDRDGRSFSARRVPPEQDHPAAVWPVRFWSRATVRLPDDPMVHACVLTYLSDISSGAHAVEGAAEWSATSLDHALWFHRPVRMDDWVLMDLVPHTVAASRGWYTGTVHDSAGRLAASLTQEVLTRPRPSSAPPAD